MDQFETVVITKHAIERFNERNIHSQIGKLSVEEKIRKLLQKAYEIEFSAKHRLKRLLMHDFDDTRYYYNNGLIFVCTCGTPMTLVTVENQEDRKFRKDLFVNNLRDKPLGLI